MFEFKDPSLLVRCRPMQYFSFTASPPAVLALATWDMSFKVEGEDATSRSPSPASSEESEYIPATNNGSEPIALQLPKEVWLEIMGKHSLDFRDLRCLARVCRAHNKLEKHPSLDALMFRTPPLLKALPNKTLLTVHPIFADLDMLDIDREDYAEGIPKWFGDDCNCDNIPGCESYATYPACKVIDVHILNFRPRRAWGSAEDGGVTVGDVLHAVLFTWDEEFRERGITREKALEGRIKRREIWRGFREAVAMKHTTHFYEKEP